MMPNNELDTLCYIREQTSFTEDYQNNFGYEMHDMGNRFYLIFDAVLHSFGVMNRNHRSYDQKNIWDCIQHDDYIQSMLRQNSWIGEIDHPSAKMKGEELMIARISNPDMERSSHYIRKPRMEGNLLIGTIQTDSSTDAGMNMAIKIVDGKIIPYFNLNFTLGPRKFKPFSIASRDNTLKSGEWFRITVVVNRTASMTLYINGVAAASADISAFADNEMTDFVRKGLAISTSKNGSFMQYRPLILDAEYDAAADIAEMKVKTGALGSLQIKNQK